MDFLQKGVLTLDDPFKLSEKGFFMVATAIPIGGAVLGGLSAMAKSISALYGMAVDINAYLDKHLTEMQQSENATIARTGRVLKMAKDGFGLGYLSSVTIIAAGQLLLGNPLTAVTTVASAVTLSNPIAMTCAAVGAIFYGWGALTETERQELLDKLSKGLEIGIELIKSLLSFVTEKTKELLSSKNVEELKKFVGSAASLFGKTLGDVTHKITDVVSDSFNLFKRKSEDAIEKTADLATTTYDSVKHAAGKATEIAIETVEKVKSKTKR